MRSISLKLSVLACLVVLSGITTPASSMPNFARKYNLGCSSCHAVVPRLNEFGWKFRAAGYRLPDEIGKAPSTFNLGDYFAGRANFAITSTSNTAAAPGSSSISNFNEQFSGASIYAMFGAITKNISSEMEIGFNPASPTNNGTSGLTFPAGVSSASIGYYSGTEDAWFSARMGILNVLQGYGGSDRGWSGSPLMNSAYPISIPAYAAGDKTKPGMTGLTGSQMGIDLGYVFNKAAVHAEILSGYAYDAKDKPFAAVGGGVPKPTGAGAGQGKSANSFDFMFWANYILTEDGGGISAAYYMGSADLPTNTTASTSNVDSLYWNNKFSRLAVYASYPVMKALILAGYEMGTDNSWTLKSFAYGADIKSHGIFGEVDYSLTDLVGIGARYDQVTPDGSVTFDNIKVITAYCDYNFGDGLSITASFATRSTDTPDSKGASLLGTAKTNTIGLRFSLIQ